MCICTLNTRSLLYITDADAIDVYNHLAGEAFIQLGGGH